jgi:hypothetical protein
VAVTKPAGDRRRPEQLERFSAPIRITSPATIAVEAALAKPPARGTCADGPRRFSVGYSRLERFAASELCWSCALLVRRAGGTRAEGPRGHGMDLPPGDGPTGGLPLLITRAKNM